MEIPKKEFDVEKELREILSDLNPEKSIFDKLLERFEKFSERPASSLGDLKRRDNKRAKGLGWERFCQFYLLKVLQYQKAWLWNEIPDDVRKYLKLGSKVDNGIDIVCLKSGVNNTIIRSAVQCKYRKKVTDTVTWKALSTFIGLCAVTGPWDEHIVMTNCKGVSRRTGIPKGPKDKTIAYGTFKGLTREQCLRTSINVPSPYQKVEGNTKPQTLEELRSLRLAKFSVE